MNKAIDKHVSVHLKKNPNTTTNCVEANFARDCLIAQALKKAAALST